MPGVQVLDKDAFVNGHRFYAARGRHLLAPSRVVAVHHNWINGDAKKFARATAYDAVTREGEGAAAFVARARAAMAAMPAWNHSAPA